MRVARNSNFRLSLLAFLLSPLTCAMATNGYFSHGYGLKAKGMGGAATATAQDAFAGANNPAAAAWAGDRIEGGVDVFMPRRDMSRTGSTGVGAGSLDANVKSGSNTFYVPEFGVNRVINKDLSLGVAVYGNGGLNTAYPGGQVACGPTPANVLCGSGELGVDLMQLVVAPTLGYKINPQHAIGVSPLLMFQQFQANGLQAFDNAPGFPPFTGAPGKVTNNGYDRSTGLGVRLGYQGKLNDQLTVGAAYSPKTKMAKLDKYAGLFADAGNFDIPENYSLGVSYQPSSAVLLALDYQRINYSGVPSVGNPSSNLAPLGAANGPGFGWRDINVWKLGAQWQYSQQLALRAGFNVGQNPVQSRDVSFNILAPGVTTTHLTLGATYALSPNSELTVAYMRAPKKRVSGSSLFNNLGFGPTVGGTESISMSQQSLGVQMGWRF
jgi:long-chain fatty acid transport protein